MDKMTFDDVFERYEQVMKMKLKKSYTTLIGEANDSLNRIITLALCSFDDIESSLHNGITELKENVVNLDNSLNIIPKKSKNSVKIECLENIKHR